MLILDGASFMTRVLVVDDDAPIWRAAAMKARHAARLIAPVCADRD
jgi:hypothetical protein